MRFKKFLSTGCASALLFSSIFCCKAEPFRCNVCFLGDTDTKKTSYIIKLQGNNRIRTDSTLLNQQNTIMLNLVDTSGAQDWSAMNVRALQDGDIFCIFLNIYDGVVGSLRNNLDDISKFNTKNPQKIIVLVPTDDDQNYGEMVDIVKQEIMQTNCNIPENQIILCSAKDNTGIEDLKGRMFELAQSLPEYQQYQEEQRQQEQLRQKRRKNLTIGSLVTAGIVTIGYGARAVYKRLTSIRI